MKLANALGLLNDIRGFVWVGLPPTVKAIFHSPSLLLQPSVISRIFMAHVWEVCADGMDENGRPSKERLINPNAVGVVLDLGAGYGHTIKYLDRTKVTHYIAVEPNVLMHPQIRKFGEGAGFNEDDGTLTILACGAEHAAAILLSPSALIPTKVDTITSVMVLCTVPSPQKTLDTLVNELLVPGGQFLFYEHVLSPRKDVASWQRFWAPLWQFIMDGCRLDRDTHNWVANMKTEDVNGEERSVWKEGEVWALDNEPEEHLFWHQVGRYVKR